MTVLSLTNPTPGTVADANVIASNNSAILAVINGGIDNTNVASGAAITASKLAGYPADATKVLLGDGSWGTAVGALATNAQVGTTYTLVLSDQDKIVEMSNAGAITLTVPTNASVGFTIGHTITLIQTGAGQVTVVGAGGVTVNANPGLKLTGQWAMAALVKRATDTWVLAGNISS